MSIKSEKIAAQKMAFNHKPIESWQRHLIGPVELEELFRSATRYKAIRELNPRQYTTLVADNLAGKGRFDEVVDQ